MKLNASTRLTAASDVDALGLWFKTLSKDQQRFYAYKLPKLVVVWLTQGFYQKLQTTRIPSLGSTEVSALLGLPDLRNMILGMAHVRKIIKPKIKGKIYRLTEVKKLPIKPVIYFTGKEQYRSLTSWTTLPEPLVVSRSTFGLPDIVLCTKLPNTDKVLFDYDSIQRTALASMQLFTRDYADDSKRKTYYDGVAWSKIQSHYMDIAKEKEVLIYLHPSDSLTCTWRESETSPNYGD